MATLDLSDLPLLGARGRGRGRALALAGPIALVTAGCLGILLLTRRSLSSDEAVAVERARAPFRDLVERAVDHDPGTLGYLALLHPLVEWNDSEWAVRAPSVVAAALAALFGYLLGRALFGRIAGAIAGLALALDAGVVASSQQVRPYALAILAILVSTLLLVLALDRSALWWIAYVPACAALSLTHPIAATVVVAHVVAAVLALRETRASVAAAAAALALGAAAAAPLTLAALADRADAWKGARLDPGEVATGLGRAAGWNVALAGLAVLGLFVLLSGRLPGALPWQAALVVGLIAAPLVGVLLAATFMPVFPARALVVCAPGLAVACGAGVAWIPDRRLALGAAGALAVLAVPALVGWYTSPAPEDWRSAVATAGREVEPGETVVVIPPRSAAAVAYYDPELRLSSRGRGAGTWVFVRSSDDRGAIRAARAVVRTPAYALLSQERYGERLVLQHWVRP